MDISTREKRFPERRRVAKHVADRRREALHPPIRLIFIALQFSSFESFQSCIFDGGVNRTNGRVSPLEVLSDRSMVIDCFATLPCNFNRIHRCYVVTLLHHYMLGVIALAECNLVTSSQVFIAAMRSITRRVWLTYGTAGFPAPKYSSGPITRLRLHFQPRDSPDAYFSNRSELNAPLIRPAEKNSFNF